MVKFWRFVLPVMALAHLGGLGANTAYAYEFEYRLDENGRILVPVTFNGNKSFDYLLATTNRRIGMRADDLDAMGVKPYYRTTIREYSPYGMIRLPAAAMPDMLIGEQLITDRYVVIYPEKAPIRGVIGFDLFGQGLIHIEPDRSVINVYANAVKVAGEEWGLLTGVPNHYGGIVIQTVYRGVELNVVVDSSISKSMMTPQVARKIIPNYNAVKHVEFAFTAMGMNTFEKALNSVILKDFKLDGWSLGDVEVVVGQVNAAEATNSDNPNVLILGADFMRKHEFALDYRDFQIWYPLH